MRFETASGAVYLIDEEESRAMRLSGPYSELIDYSLRPDTEWAVLDCPIRVALGESVQMCFIDGTYRITTPVVAIDKDGE